MNESVVKAALYLLGAIIGILLFRYSSNKLVWILVIILIVVIIVIIFKARDNHGVI